MVDVLLATGFSVDFTAHVTHQFYAKKGTKVVKLANSLHEMCAPMVQVMLLDLNSLICTLLGRFLDCFVHVASDICAYIRNCRFCKDGICCRWNWSFARPLLYASRNLLATRKLWKLSSKTTRVTRRCTQRQFNKRQGSHTV